MAQGQRAGLITPRTQDRNLLPVYHHHIASVHQGTRAPFKGTYGSPLTPPFKYGQGVRGDSMSPAEQLSSLVAQWKRAVKHRQSTSRCENIRQTDGYRLMSRRTHDRNVSGEYHHHIASVHQGTRATFIPL